MANGRWDKDVRLCRVFDKQRMLLLCSDDSNRITCKAQGGTERKTKLLAFLR